MFILRIIAAHFHKVGRAFDVYGNMIATGIEADNQEMRKEGYRGLRLLLIPRLVLWGGLGIYYAWQGLLIGYVEFVGIFYIIAAIVIASTKAPEPPKQEVVTPLSDTAALKRAKVGLNNLLDIILVVLQSLEQQLTDEYTIQCPKSKGRLAYTNIKNCIRVENGVASTTVAFPYRGEVNKEKVMEDFNDCLFSLLTSGELPGRPLAVFTGTDNVPRAGIQAIHCDIVGDLIILEVIQSTEEAIPLLNALENADVTEPNEQGVLYDNDP